MTAAITWHRAPIERLDAPQAFALALSRATWEAAGATFYDRDDGNGETPGLATATLTIDDDHTVDFGVLDYGEDSVAVLAPEEASGTVFAALRQAGLITDPDAQLIQPTLVSSTADQTLIDRVRALENVIAAAAKSPQTPQAFADAAVEWFTRYRAS